MSNDITLEYFKLRADAEKNELGKAMKEFSENQDSKTPRLPVLPVGRLKGLPIDWDS